MQARTVTLVAAATAVLLAAGAWYAVTLPLTPNDAVRIGDQLDAPAGWAQQADHVVGPSLLCWGGDGCPSLAREWTSPRPVTDAELQRVLAAAGWSLRFDRSCETADLDPDRLARTADTALCTADGEVDGHPVRVRLGTRDAQRSPTTVTLWVN